MFRQGDAVLLDGERVIYRDAPIVWKETLGPSCHLISDLPGPEGTDELVATAALLGLSRRYIQHRNTEYEHFDLWGRRLAAAQAQNIPEIDRVHFVQILRVKREERVRLGLPVRTRKHL